MVTSDLCSNCHRPAIALAILTHHTGPYQLCASCYGHDGERRAPAPAWSTAPAPAPKTSTPRHITREMDLK